MTLRQAFSWLFVLALTLLLFTSCAAGTHYRYAAYQFGQDAGWDHWYGPAPWDRFPEFDESDRGGPAAEPLPVIGMPDPGGGGPEEPR